MSFIVEITNCLAVHGELNDAEVFEGDRDDWRKSIKINLS